jgi:galactokinase
MIDLHRLNRLRATFEERFGAAENLTLARAPGRVNLIGEHTDYHGGYVLPMAVELDLAVLGAPSVDGRFRIFSVDFHEMGDLRPGDITGGGRQHWLNYVKGVAKFLAEAGVPLVPCNAVMHATVPIGGGLSSSAAIEVGFAKFMLELAGKSLDGVMLAKLCRRAENEFVGVGCGIMDQYVAVFGQEGNAVFIDCKTLKHKLLPLFGPQYEFVIADSTVRHKLAASEYHTRQKEGREGLEALSTTVGKRAMLRDVTDDEYLKHRHLLRPVVRKRLDHVFGENRRTLDAAEALGAHDPARFGALMNASHDSLRDDYEVSCAQIDVLVEAARRVRGVLGSRITGGGFGGCTVTLLEARAAEDFIRLVGTEYRKRTKLEAKFIRTRAADGATAERLG